MLNPFDNDEVLFLVLINAEGHISLWPAFVEVPSGWRVQYGPDHRQNCLARIHVKESR
jgi:MbtH protein